jgi:hypothetical protein
MPKVQTVTELQDVLSQWFRKPGETDEQWRNRINNNPNLEISIPLLGKALPNMLHEQEDEIRFERAKPAEDVYPSIEECEKLDTVLDKANKKEPDDGGEK